MMKWEELRKQLIRSRFHYFHTDNGVLLNGDCLEVMNELPREEISLVLTDPPYNIGKDYGSYKDNRRDGDFYKWIESIFVLLKDLLKNRCHLVFTCAQKQIWFYKPMLENHGFAFRHLAIWHNPKRKAGSYPGQWSYSYEPIMDFTKGKFRKLNNKNSIGFTDVWIEEPPRHVKHPTKRPIRCWEDLVKLLSNENDLVLDPFLGSGTTAMVCEKLNRRWVGVEIEEKYCEIAQERVLGRDKNQRSLEEFL